MKKKFAFLFAVFILIITAFGFSQTKEINGAWEFKDEGNQTILLFQDGYFTNTRYSSNEFLQSWGGTYKIDGKQIKIWVEFNSADSARIGTQRTFSYSINKKQLEINFDKSTKYNRIDDGKAPLSGVWKINGRMQEGNLVSIHQTGARKTLKILTGKRFQWFAINPGTKEFSGTGGGTYTFVNGQYTENILFFSRDNSRTGAQLTFDGKLENGQWHHSGLSSKGDKIYEVWGKVGK